MFAWKGDRGGISLFALVVHLLRHPFMYMAHLLRRILVTCIYTLLDSNKLDPGLTRMPGEDYWGEAAYVVHQALLTPVATAVGCKQDPLSLRMASLALLSSPVPLTRTSPAVLRRLQRPLVLNKAPRVAPGQRRPRWVQVHASIWAMARSPLVRLRYRGGRHRYHAILVNLPRRS